MQREDEESVNMVKWIVAAVYFTVLAFGWLCAMCDMADNCCKQSGRTDEEVFMHDFGIALLWPLFLVVIVMKALVSGLNSFISILLGD